MHFDWTAGPKDDLLVLQSPTIPWRPAVVGRMVPEMSYCNSDESNPQKVPDQIEAAQTPKCLRRSLL